MKALSGVEFTEYLSLVEGNKDSSMSILIWLCEGKKTESFKDIESQDMNALWQKYKDAKTANPFMDEMASDGGDEKKD